MSSPRSCQSEETRLLSLREALPSTVNEAMGVTSLKEQLDDATAHLETMKSVSRDPRECTGLRCGGSGSLPSGRRSAKRRNHGANSSHGPSLHHGAPADSPRHRNAAGARSRADVPAIREFRGQIVDVPMLADTTGSTGDTLAAVRIEPVGRLVNDPGWFPG
ncbi:MAG: hypothetical protein U0936_04170 [Planctomycetaceae bacterium]